MQDMHNPMISFEHMLMIDPKRIGSPPLQLLTKPDATPLGETSMCHWYIFCDKDHDPMTYKSLRGS